MDYYTLVQNSDDTLGTIKLSGTLYPDVFEMLRQSGLVRIPLPFDGRKQILGDFIRAIFNPQTLEFKALPWRQRYARRVRDPAFKDAIKLAAEGVASGSVKIQAGIDALRKVGSFSEGVLHLLEEFKTEFSGLGSSTSSTPGGDLNVFFSLNPAFNTPDTVPVELLGDAGKVVGVTGVIDSFANTPMIHGPIADRVNAKETGQMANIKGVGGNIRVPLVTVRARLGKGGIEIPVDAAKVLDLRSLVGFDFLVSQGMKNYAKALGRPIV